MDGMQEIIVNDPDLYHTICSFFDREIPERSYLIRLYDDAGYPLGKLYSTQTAIENALKERVWLKHGGYLVIQVTEALTVVDVNSGKSIKNPKYTGCLKTEPRSRPGNRPADPAAKSFWHHSG